MMFRVTSIHIKLMWPQVVANKVPRKPFGSIDYFADFPSSESFIQDVCSDLSSVSMRRNDSKMEKHNYKLFASTWNVGGIPPSDDLALEDWLDTKNNTYDIYVLGFQEMIPLSTKNVLGPEKIKASAKWNSLIRATLNKSLGNLNELNSCGKEPTVLYPTNTGKEDGFKCIINKQMVGVSVSVWIRGYLLQYVRHPSVSCVGCGILGCLGNKGSVSVRFFLHETSFCFVCCHLASGGKEGDAANRNSNATDIFSRTSFPRSHPLNLPQKILEHERIILLGDLNYRISLPESETRVLVEQKEWDILLEKDQLQGEITNGKTFDGWNEGAITFTPTYKYYLNSDDYYGCLQHKKGEKKRAPAWCDRILWYGKGLKQVYYDRYESKHSDHRPVRSAFDVAVESLKTNSLRSIFLSERFDHLQSPLDFLSIDHHSNRGHVSF